MFSFTATSRGYSKTHTIRRLNQQHVQDYLYRETCIQYIFVAESII